MDGSNLLKSAKKLDQGALLSIFDTFAPDVYRYVFRLYHDPIRSDNIVGDVFSRFLENVVNYQMPSFNLRVYIFQITYQTIVDKHNDDPSFVIPGWAPSFGWRKSVPAKWEFFQFFSLTPEIPLLILIRG